MDLPSNIQIEDEVDLDFYASGIIKNCIVKSIKFELDKVRYSILIPIGDENYTLIENVDSSFVR